MSNLLEREARGALDASSREVKLARALGAPVWLSWALLAAVIALWAGAFLHGLLWLGPRLDGASGEQATRLTLLTGMKLSGPLLAGQWWRALSSLFVHLDIMHLAFNGYGLYVVAPLMERLYGVSRTLVLYIVAGVVGALASALLSAVPSGGASGAIYGIIGALLVFGLKHRSNLPAQMSRALTIGMLPWLVFGIGIGFLESVPMDNAAHIGGLLSGAALAGVMRSRLGAPTRMGDRLAMVAAWACVLALAVTAVFWALELQQCAGSQQDLLSCYSAHLKAR